MKKLLLLLLLISSTMLYADTYKILFINTEGIKIGGKKLNVGDTFSDSDIISWSSAKQAIKVQNLQKHTIRLFTATQMNKSKSISDFYLKTNKLSTRGEDEPNIHLDDVLDAPCYILESLQLVTWIATTKSDYYILKYKIDNQDYSVKLKGEDKLITIDANIPGRDAGKNNPSEITAELWFHFANGQEEQIADEWKLVFVDTQVQ